MGTSVSMDIPTQGEIRFQKFEVQKQDRSKGFIQEYGVNFDELFSPMVNIITIRFLLIVGEDMELHQLDVKMTFLHNDLEKEIYMEQLQGFMPLGIEYS